MLSHCHRNPIASDIISARGAEKIRAQMCLILCAAGLYICQFVCAVFCLDLRAVVFVSICVSVELFSVGVFPVTFPPQEGFFFTWVFPLGGVGAPPP